MTHRAVHALEHFAAEAAWTDPLAELVRREQARRRGRDLDARGPALPFDGSARPTVTSSQAGRSGRSVDGRGTGELRWPFRTVNGSLPGYGTRPVSISNTIAPMLYTSERASTTDADNCSGAA